MSFLLDTNVVSEWTKPRPNAGVIDWLANADEDSVYLSVVTLAELRHGIQRLSPGKRRAQLDEWLHADLLLRFERRILPVDIAVADQGGHLVARCESRGRSIHAMDALIAATAEVNSLTLVTRNASDFSEVTKSIVDPWK